MIHELEADSTGISLRFDSSHVISAVTNYFKNTLVGGGCWFVDVEGADLFGKKYCERETEHKYSFCLKASYLFRSVWAFVFMFLTSASVCILCRY